MWQSQSYALDLYILLVTLIIKVSPVLIVASQLKKVLSLMIIYQLKN